MPLLRFERSVKEMTEKLKPCPFCGSKSVTGVVVVGLRMFLCYSCGATVSFQGKERDPQATKAWNRRADNAN